MTNTTQRLLLSYKTCLPRSVSFLASSPFPHRKGRVQYSARVFLVPLLDQLVDTPVLIGAIPCHSFLTRTNSTLISQAPLEHLLLGQEAVGK